jgi:serine/threonine-protein kinase
LAYHGQVEEGLVEIRQALALDPKNQDARTNLAFIQRRQAALTQTAASGARSYLRGLALRQGHGEQVRAAWQKTLESNPPAHDAWFGYAELCLFLGHEDEYRRARRALLGRFGTTIDPLIAERTGRACLLLPASGDELQQATALIARARAAGPRHWAYSYFLFAQGLAEYRQGRFDRAITVLTKWETNSVLGPAPNLVLAMAQHQRGQKQLARQVLAAAILAFDWRAVAADNGNAWMHHALRREAETLIVPNLAALLKGKEQPQDNEERLALLGACQSQGLWLSAARLYADAFAADPSLAEDVKTQGRYRAAVCAALASSATGKETSSLGAKEKAYWRKQAVDWLRADLALRSKALQTGSEADLSGLQQLLRQWQGDSDLAAIRDADVVALLPADEQEACRKLWAGVAMVLKKAQEKPR